MTNRPAVARAVLALVLTLGIACSSQGPTSPTPPAPNAWRGSVQDFRLGNGVARIELQGTVGDRRGTWSASFPNGSSSAGQLSERPMPGFSQLADFRFGCGAAPAGSATLRIAGDSITGTYFSTDCASLESGTLTLTAER